MARLPQPGGDPGTWGDVLNDFLNTAHQTDGTLKSGVIDTASIQSGAVTSIKISDNSVTTPKLVDGAVTTVKIGTASAPSAGQILSYDGSTLEWTNTGSPDPAMGGDLTGPASNAQIIDDAVGSNQLANNAVGTLHLQDDAVTLEKIAASNAPSSGQVLSYDGTSLEWINDATGGGGGDPTMGGDLSGLASDAQIVAGAVGSTELANNAVATANLQNLAVTTGKLANDAVDATKLADNAVDTTAIVNSAVTEAKLDGAVQTKLNAVNNSVTIAKAGVDVGTRPKLNFIEGTNVTISTADDVVNNRVDISVSATGSGGAADATTTSKGIVQLAGDLAGTADTPLIAAGAVTNSKLAATSVATGNLQDLAVTTAKIADANITNAKLGDASVGIIKLNTSNSPTNGQVLSYNGTTMTWVNAASSNPTMGGDISGTASNAQIVANAVGSTEIASNAVTTAKIADSNVTTNKLVNDAVTEPKLAASNSPANGQVLGWNGSALTWTTVVPDDPSMGGDISGTASAAQIVGGAVGATELATNAVTTIKINDGAVTTAKLGTTGAPTNGQLLSYNGTTMAWTTVSGADPTMGGDISGTASNAQIVAGAVGATELASDAVTEPKLAVTNTPTSGQVLSYNGSALAWANASSNDPTVGGDISGTASNAQIVAGAVGATELATNAVTTVKITDLNVSTAKLANDAVTEPKLSVSNSPTTGHFLSWNGSALTWAAETGGSSGRFTAVTKTADYTALDYEFIIGNAVGGGFTVTLPAAINGGWVRVKKTDSSGNAIIIAPPSGQIDNLTTDVVNSQWQSQDYASDGTKWYRI
jgi:hypothetical protein